MSQMFKISNKHLPEKDYEKKKKMTKNCFLFLISILPRKEKGLWKTTEFMSHLEG